MTNYLHARHKTARWEGSGIDDVVIILTLLRATGMWQQKSESRRKKCGNAPVSAAKCAPPKTGGCNENTCEKFVSREDYCTLLY